MSRMLSPVCRREMSRLPITITVIVSLTSTTRNASFGHVDLQTTPRSINDVHENLVSNQTMIDSLRLPY